MVHILFWVPASFDNTFFTLNFAKIISIEAVSMQASKAHILSELQKDILLLQGFKPANDFANNVGLDSIKDAFPNCSFPLAAVHEFFCSSQETLSSSAGFIAGILSFLMKQNGVSVWVTPTQNIFPPALKAFGIQSHQVIFIQPKNPKQILWAIEEALKCDGLSSVVGEINEISFTESRRLQLAVEQSKVTGFLLRQNPKNLATACVTRWRIKSQHTENENGLPGIGFPTWNVELLKVRNGKAGSWQMEWRKKRFELIQGPTLIKEVEQRKIV